MPTLRLYMVLRTPSDPAMRATGAARLCDKSSEEMEETWGVVATWGVVGAEGLEPPTYGLKVRSSTN